MNEFIKTHCKTIKVVGFTSATVLAACGFLPAAAVWALIGGAAYGVQKSTDQ